MSWRVAQRRGDSPDRGWEGRDEQKWQRDRDDGRRDRRGYIDDRPPLADPRSRQDDPLVRPWGGRGRDAGRGEDERWRDRDRQERGGRSRSPRRSPKRSPRRRSQPRSSWNERGSDRGSWQWSERSHDESGRDGWKKSERGSAGQEGARWLGQKFAPVTETMKVPEAACELIVGPEGSTVQEIKEETGVKIDIDKADFEAPVKITGSRRGVDKAKELIAKVLEGVDLEGVNDEIVAETSEDVLEETVEVSPAMAKDGERWRRMEKETGAKIVIVKHTGIKIRGAGDSEKPVTVRIRGAGDSVAMAIDAISVLMDEFGEKPPTNSDVAEIMSEEIMECPMAIVPRVLGTRGDVIKKVQADSGARIDIDKSSDPAKVKVTGTVNAVAEAVDKLSAIIYDDAAIGDVEELMEVPIHFSGKIIGHRGERITEIKDQTGAHIWVDKAETTCTVRISGTEQQVKDAQVKVQAIVDEADTNEGYSRDERRERPLRHGESTEEMEVHSDLVLRIIGKGGKQINRMQEDSGAKIDVNNGSRQPPKSGEPSVVHFTGSKEAITRARALVEKLVSDLGYLVGRNNGWTTAGARAAKERRKSDEEWTQEEEWEDASNQHGRNVRSKWETENLAQPKSKASAPTGPSAAPSRALGSTPVRVPGIKPLPKSALGKPAIVPKTPAVASIPFKGSVAAKAQPVAVKPVGRVVAPSRAPDEFLDI